MIIMKWLRLQSFRKFATDIMPTGLPYITWMDVQLSVIGNMMSLAVLENICCQAY